MAPAAASPFDVTRLIRIYYAATLLFLLLDYVLNINVRLAFLEAWPQMRVVYYLLCFGCLGLMIWRPGWSLWIGTLESLLALSLLIVTMGVRVMTVSGRMLETSTGPPTMSEISNFVLVAGIAWLSFTRGITAIRKRTGAL